MVYADVHPFKFEKEMFYVSVFSIVLLVLNAMQPYRRQFYCIVSLLILALGLGGLFYVFKSIHGKRSAEATRSLKPATFALTGEALHPQKTETLAELRKRQTAERLRNIWRGQNTPEVEVLICVEDDTVLPRLEQTYPAFTCLRKTDDVLRCKLPTALAERFLEELPEGVKWINETAEPVLLNSVATGSRFLGLNAPLREKTTAPTLDGRGEIVAVIDTGVSTGNAATFHSSLIHALYGMVIDPVSGLGDWGGGDSHGHGTHVCGSVVSRDVMDVGTLGAAPGAHLFSQRISKSGTLKFFDKNEKHFERSYAVGARVISCSWKNNIPSTAIGNPLLYVESYAESVDSFVWNHPDTTICFAVDNSGQDTNEDGVIDLGNVYSYEAYAKNIITVGAQESYRPRGTDPNYTGLTSTKTYAGYGSATGPFPLNLDKSTPSEPYDTYDGMAAFSSRGPLNDGRIAPMLVAPGTDIYSTSEAGGARFDGGTSMATPLVSGSAAVLRQYLRECQGIETPSAAVVRAGLILCSDTLYPGQYGTGDFLEIPKDSPNNVEGWGALHLGKYLTGEARIGFVDRISLETEAVQTFTIPDVTAGTELSVVLSWIDAPGISENRILVNDYDLVVVAPDNTVYSIKDATNPIERILIPAEEVQDGDYLVKVVGTLIKRTGTGNIAAVAWRAATAKGPVPLPEPIVESEEKVTLTVREPLGAEPYLDFPLYPAPGEMEYPKGTKLRVLSGPKLPNYFSTTTVPLCGWILKKADGTVMRGTESTFDLVLDQDMSLHWFTVFPGYGLLLH